MNHTPAHHYKNKIIVIYHGRCDDGLTAAWVLDKYFNKVNADLSYQVTFVAGFHGEKANDSLAKCNAVIDAQTDVFIIDFSYGKDQIIALSEQCHHLWILDHHITAKDNLSELDFIQNLTLHFDMNRCGARICWDYFFNENAPELINWVMDRDMWQFNHLPHSAHYHAATSLIDKNSLEDYFAFLNQDNHNEALRHGEILLNKQAMEVASLAKYKHPMTLKHGGLCWAVNSNMHSSDLGNYIALEHPELPVLIYGYKMKTGADGIEKGMWVCSLRSVGDVDVSVIAKQYGGGGHKNASGFGIDKLENL